MENVISWKKKCVKNTKKKIFFSLHKQENGYGTFFGMEEVFNIEKIHKGMVSSLHLTRYSHLQLLTIYTSDNDNVKRVQLDMFDKITLKSLQIIC
jgi:hypothetical protein